MIEKLLLFMREVHNKKIHSYPKDVLIAAVIFAAAVCQWGGNHGNAAAVVSTMTLQPEKVEKEMKTVAITFDDDVIIGLSQEISYKEAVSMI